MWRSTEKDIESRAREVIEGPLAVGSHKKQDRIIQEKYRRLKGFFRQRE